MIAALRDLISRATPGPVEWTTNADGYPVELTALGVGVLRPGIAVGPSDGGLCAYLTNDGDSAEATHPDFALIVAAVNNLPSLLDIAEAVRAYKTAGERRAAACEGRQDRFDRAQDVEDAARVALFASLDALEKDK